MTTQLNRDIEPRANALESTMALRLWNFMRMHPPIFHGSKVGEYPQSFLHKVYTIVQSMGVTSKEKAELASYILKDLPHVWFTQWEDSRTVESGPLEWEEFKEIFLERYSPVIRGRLRLKSS